MRLKVVLTVLAYWYMTSIQLVSAQVVFKGPTEAKPGRMTKITLTQVQGQDLKIQGFFNGQMVPEDDWTIMKNLKDQFVIFLLTDKQGYFTFIAAVNDKNTTFLSNHVVKIGSPDPTPIPPVPPKPPAPTDDLTTNIKAAYNAAPDPVNLPKLISIFEEVSGQSYTNYDQMEKVLTATATKFLKDGDLRKVRDTISSYLLKTLGEDSRSINVDKAKSAYGDVLKVLKSL